MGFRLDKPETPMSLKLSRLPAVLERTGLSASTIYDKVAPGEFPKPIKLGAKSVGWLDHEIDEWIEARMAERVAEVRP
jgi:prophage regulatory protein